MGNLFPPVPKTGKLKMLQQPVSNEFPLILPVPIVMMFSSLCFNKVSGRTYLQAKRVSSFHHMNKSLRPEAEQCKRAKRVCPFQENPTQAPTEALGRGAYVRAKRATGLVREACRGVP